MNSHQENLINQPKHYQSSSSTDIQCWDAQHAALGDAAFIAHCRATAIKYLWRDKWENIEDLRKAVAYINKAIEVAEQQ